MKASRLLLSRLFLWLALALPLTVPTGRAAEDLARPIAVKPDGYTSKAYYRQLTAWKTRIYADSFHARGRTDKPWDADAEAFLRQVLAYWSEGEEEGEAGDLSPDRQARRGELAVKGRKLLAAGCDDPAVLYLATLLNHQENKDWRPAFAGYEKAIQRFGATTIYPRAVAIDTGLALRVIYQENGYGGARTQTLDVKLLDWLLQSVADGSFTKDEDFLFVHHLVGVRSWRSLFARHAAAITKWLPDSPVPEWARRTLIGINEVNLAWRARGSGWADEVEPEKWEGFSQHLQAARQELTQAWKLRPDRPEAASQMITVVMAGEGEKGDTLRQWFDRAVAAQFDYDAAYHAMLWALRPRWEGSRAEMLAFGRLCLATKRFDTWVPSKYFYAVDEIASELPDWRDVYHRPDVANDVLTLSWGLVNDPARQAEQPLRLSYLAVNAWMCDRIPEANKALATLAGKSGFQAFAAEKLLRFGADQGTCLSEVALLSGPAQAEYRQARSLDQAGKVELAIAAYQSVLQKAGPADPAAYLPRRRLYALGIERQLAAGHDWVKVDPGDHLPDWHQISGRWSIVDGALQNEGENASAMLILPARVWADFEMRGHFQVDSKDDFERAMGVVFSCDERDQQGGDWQTCEAWQPGKSKIWQGSLLSGSRLTKDLPPASTHLEPANTFLVQCWQGVASFYLNDKPLVRNFEHHRNVVVGRPDDGPQVGFGGRFFRRGNTLKISGIEVRRLTAAPTPPPAAGAAPGATP